MKKWNSDIFILKDKAYKEALFFLLYNILYKIAKKVCIFLYKITIYILYKIKYNKVTRLIQSNTDKPEKLRTSNPYTCEDVPERANNRQEDDWSG